MCWLSCFIFFWNTKYNTPRTFCLASYSVVFHDRCICLLPYISTNHSYCIRALRSDPSNQYTTLSHTNWQVGFVVKSAPPVTFHPLKFPLRACKRTFFSLHLLHCYNHRFCQWSDPRGPEQACLNRPLLAQACRMLVLWASHLAYLSSTASRLQDIKLPLNSYTTAHQQDSNLRTLPIDNAMLQPYQRGLRLNVHVYKNFLYVNFLKNNC